MRPAVELLLACAGLSLSISYLWWVWWRVWVFRQDLFQIRDQLWDGMRAQGALDDPAYRECRRDINAMIRLAPVLSLFTFLKLVEIVEADPAGRAPNVSAAVREARAAVFFRVFRFLFLESLSGLVVTGLAVAFGLNDMLNKYFLTFMERFFDSKGVQAFARRLAHDRRKMPA